MVVAFVVPSNASGGTSVALRESSPSGRITAEVGDAVRFTNEDDQQHVLRSASGNWSFSLTLAPGESARVPAPLGDEPASYVLTDSYIAGEGADPLAEAVTLLRRIGPIASAIRTSADPHAMVDRLATVLERYRTGDLIAFPAAAWLWRATA